MSAEKPSTFTPEELRQRFNPEGSMLRRQQWRMLEMLTTLDAICRRHDIHYWLSSGTLLGCVRHGGFIPWDDDLDVEMLRDDYLRLLEVLPKELPEYLVLQTHETDPGYFFAYAKLRDQRSHLQENTGYDDIFHYQGIYIDIFVMENIPLWLHKLSCLTIGHIYKVARDKSRSAEQRIRGIKWWYGLNHRFFYPMMRCVARLFPSGEMRHTYGTPYPKSRLKKDVFPLKEAQFEGRSFPVPHDSDAYLRRMFGDYMKLPKLEDIHPHWSELEITN